MSRTYTEQESCLRLVATWMLDNPWNPGVRPIVQQMRIVGVAIKTATDQGLYSTTVAYMTDFEAQRAKLQAEQAGYTVSPITVKRKTRSKNTRDIDGGDLVVPYSHCAAPAQPYESDGDTNVYGKRMNVVPKNGKIISNIPSYGGLV